MNEHRKQTIYFTTSMIKEIREEAKRQQRPFSWILQQAWLIARSSIMNAPSVEDVVKSMNRGAKQNEKS